MAEIPAIGTIPKGGQESDDRIAAVTSPKLEHPEVAQFYQPTVPEEVEAVQEKNGVDKEDVEADDLDKIQQDAP